MMTYQQAAKFLGIKIETLRSMVSAGKVPVIRSDDGTVTFDQDALTEWNAARPGHRPYVRGAAQDRRFQLRMTDDEWNAIEGATIAKGKAIGPWIVQQAVKAANRDR